jgi:hypothetical protein
MNSLNQAVEAALKSSGASKEANKAYLEFIKANFIVPVEIDSSDDNPAVLFLEDGEHVFLPVFSEKSFLDAWATDISTQIKVLHLSAVDLLKGISDGVTVCLDIGSAHFKEFNPAEIARMRSMILKLFKN